MSSVVGLSSQNPRFSVQDIPGLTLWLDGSDSNSMTLSGSNVTQWRDKSGLANHSTNVLNTPVWDPTLINGRPGVYFSNAGMWGSFQSTLSTPDVHVFLVMNRIPISSDPYTRYFLMDDGVTDGYNTTTGGGFMNNGFNELTWQRNGVRGRGQAMAEAVSLFNAPNLGAKMSVSKNGGSYLDVSNNATSGFASTNWRIGVDGIGNTIAWAVNFYIAEILVFNSVLSRPQSQSIESYLTQKWGLSAYPKDIPGCALWLDAADRATLTVSSSNTVTGWTDKSGAGRTVTVNSAGTYSSTGMQGRPTVTFGSGNYMTTSTASTFGNTFTAIMVFSTSNTSYPVPLAMGSLTTPFYMWYRGDFGTYQISEETAGSIGNNYYTSANIPLIMTGLVNSSSPYWRIFLNGSNVIDPRIGGSGTAPLANLGGSNVYIPGQLVQFGGPTGGSSVGNISEVILYSNVLTTTQRLAVEGYLSTKWGLSVPSKPQFLPSTHPFPYQVPATRPFYPQDIEGLALWLDAADSATFTLSAGNITKWNDKSVLGNHATATGSPTLSTAAFGGRQTVYFNGTDVRGTISITGATFTVFAVYQPNTLLGSTRDQRVVSFASAGNYDWNNVLRSTGINIQAGAPNSNQITTYRGGTMLARSDTLHVAGVPAVGCAQYTGSTAYVFMNGRKGTTLADTSGNFGISTYGIATQPSTTSERLIGYVAEVLVYTTSLSASQRQQVEGYLSDKWGLRSTMGGSAHPYRYSAPSVLPTQFTGCTMWLDAADASSMTLSGSNVTTWRDKSSNAYSGTSSGSPVLTTVGGYPAVTFDGATQYFTFGDVANLGTAPLNIFAVSKFNTTGDGTIVAKSSYGAVGRYALLRTGGNLIPLVQGASTTNQPGVADTNITRRLLAWTWDRATQSIYQNGGSTAIVSSAFSDTTSFNTTFPFLIGAYNDGGTGGLPPQSGLYLNGSINEVVCIFGTMTTSDRQQMEGYLSWKWGLAGKLPPYPTDPWLNFKRTYTPVFAPNQLAGCALWLDGADPTSVTLSGSSVTAWADKSGNAVAITVGGSGGLTYSSNRVSTSSAQTSYFSVPVDIRKSVMPNMTLFMVYTWLGKASSQINSTLWGNDNPNSGNRTQYVDFTGYSPNAYSYYLNNGYLTNPELNTSSQVLYSVVDQLNVTNGTAVWINGTLGSGGTGTSLSNTTYSGNEILYFGAGETSSLYPSYAAFNEILIYSNALTTAQRQQVEGYLAWKWGKTSDLSSSHPYKTFKP